MTGNEQTLMGAIIGAGPTVLIAYFLEFRYFKTLVENRSFALGMFGYVGAAATANGTIYSVVALGSNEVSAWYVASVYAFCFGVTLLFIFGAWGTFISRKAF